MLSVNLIQMGIASIGSLTMEMMRRKTIHVTRGVTRSDFIYTIPISDEDSFYFIINLLQDLFHSANVDFGL